MAWLKLTMPLYLLGALMVSPAYFQQPPCEVVRKTVPRGSFRLDVEPGAYAPNDIYTGMWIFMTHLEDALPVLALFSGAQKFSRHISAPWINIYLLVPATAQRMNRRIVLVFCFLF